MERPAVKSGRLECTEKHVLAFIIVDAIPVRRHALDWILTLKAPCKICSRQHFEFFTYYLFIFQGKQVLTVHVAWLMIHMKCQDFSLKK